MKNKLTDLNDHLFAQLERLNDEDLKPEELEREIARSKAISQVSDQVINNAKTAIEAEKTRHEYFTPGRPFSLPKMIGGDTQ